MPTATMKFKLPDEQCEHEAATHGMDWKLCVSDVDDWLRNALKYGHDYETIDQALNSCRDYLRGAVSERGLSLEDV